MFEYLLLSGEFLVVCFGLLSRSLAIDSQR